MSIDINKIAQEKITEMEKNGEIKKHLEEKLQKLILDSVSSAWTIVNNLDTKRRKELRVK